MNINYIKRSKILFSLALIFRMLTLKRLRGAGFRHNLSPKEKEILKTLQEDGIVVIPGYFSQTECSVLRSEYDLFAPTGSLYCPNENEKRVFGMDRLSDKIKSLFSEDKVAWKVCESYLGEPMRLQTTMSARIDFKEGVKYGSGGSWHRDSFSRQVKSFSYLVDMTSENGPFMYIKGSHKLLNILKVIWSNFENTPAGNTRYSDQYIVNAQKVLNQEIVYHTCKAGDLILADIRGLHTTSKVQKGYAYSIFNYYIASRDHQQDSSAMKSSEACVNKHLGSLE